MITNDYKAMVRIPSSVLKDVDALARRISKPGMRVTRATLLRMLILSAIANPPAEIFGGES